MLQYTMDLKILSPFKYSNYFMNVWLGSNADKDWFCNLTFFFWGGDLYNQENNYKRSEHHFELCSDEHN